MDGLLTTQYWTEQASLKAKLDFAERPRRNWWDHPYATRLYRDQYRVDAAPHYVRPAHLLLKDCAGPRKRGVSFASGTAFKEILLVKLGLVEHITCVEISPALCEAARAAAVRDGLTDRMTIVCAPFETFAPQAEGYDLVIWDHGLHHMFDCKAAIRRSVEILESGGVFVMDDFVGPTYNQYTDEEYQSAQRIRAVLPAEWFEEPAPLARQLGRIPVEAYKKSDPSEAADSAAILPALADLGAEVFRLGGHAFALALREAYFKFDENDETHRALMRGIFEIDRAYRDKYCHFALAFWKKP